MRPQPRFHIIAMYMWVFWAFVLRAALQCPACTLLVACPAWF